MKKKISRRKFVKTTGTVGIGIAGIATVSGLSSCSLFEPPADISVITGADYYNNTIEAVNLIGGIEKFIQPGQKVGLLINSDFEVFGAYTNPDIAIAIIKLIADAGASEICCLQHVKMEYWKRSAHFESHQSYIESLLDLEVNAFPSEYNEDDFVKLTDQESWKALKETEVVKAWLDCDIFVNMPIAKHHMTTLLTGAMKNIMGVSTRKANVTFHLGSGVRNDPDYLAQCIADQNASRKTDLCIMDATEFIIDNGPSGPGTLKKPMKIAAGSDIVAMDALASTWLGYLPDEILTTVKGHEIGLGTMDFSSLNIIEKTI